MEGGDVLGSAKVGLSFSEVNQTRQTEMKYKISIFLMLVIMGISQLNGQKLTNFNFLGVKTFYQDETRISKKQFVSLLSNNTEAYKTWQKSNRNKYVWD